MNDQVPVELHRSLTLPAGAVIKNRIFKSAMSEQLADRHHNPGQSLETLYKRWAEGGTGLIVSGNLMVDRQHLGEPRNVVLDADSDLAAFSRWTTAGTANGAAFWAQLNHPGKQSPAFINKQPVAPSAVPLAEHLQANFNTPRELESLEIDGIIEKFARAAALAKQTGFTGVQIHAAHGYLIGQFLSARHNKRTDKWGGSLENRMRLLMNIYHAMRDQVGPEFPIGVKLNSADFSDGGFDENDSVNVLKALSQAGVDILEVSGGSYEMTAMSDGIAKAASTQKREAYFLDFAQKCRTEISTPVVVTGGFRTSTGMRAALAEGATDMIGLARPLALDPDFAQKVITDVNSALQLPDLSTGIRKLDKMVLLNMSWYEVQLSLLGKGKKPNPRLNAWIATFMVFLHMGVFAFRQRRG